MPCLKAIVGELLRDLVDLSGLAVSVCCLFSLASLIVAVVGQLTLLFSKNRWFEFKNRMWLKSAMTKNNADSSKYTHRAVIR